MKEVEILVNITERLSSALKKLEKFNFIGKRKVFDIYFFDPIRKKISFDAKDILSQSFRIRQKGQECYLTHKINNFDENGRWIYSDELETKIFDFKIAIKIIERLGLKKLIEINNMKYIFTTDDYEIVLEDVNNLGVFLEIEKLGVKDNEDIEKIRKDMFNFLDSINIKYGKELSVGKPELMIKKVYKSKQ